MAPPPPKSWKRFKGFTLAELLISVLILGEIATFTIPKLLGAQQNRQAEASAKEAISMISGAYQQHANNGLLTTSTKPSDLMPYMNYIAIDTSSIIDDVPNSGTLTCSPTEKCIKLHTGGLLRFADLAGFSGSTNLSAAWFSFDPNGTADTGGGLEGGLWIALYYNGRVSTLDKISANTVSTDGTRGPDLASKPSWFSW